LKIKEFEKSLSESSPPSHFSEELKSLWHAKKDHWEEAHSIAQDIDNANGYWIHAYLHRVEGDLGNANYWYRQSGKAMPSVSLSEELEVLIQSFFNENE